MNNPHSLVTPIRKQAIDVLKRARKLPVGHDRNDLRQLAIGLLWLEKHGHTKPLQPPESHALSE
jgi:hypothetical protein